MSRVRIGTCSGLADAAVVRAAMDAHDIPVVINAEQHASMLGGLGGAFVPLHIFVDDAYAEEAAAVLAELRDHGGGRDRSDDALEEAEGTAETDEPEPEPEAFADEQDVDDEDDDAAMLAVRADRRRRISIVFAIGFAMAFAAPLVADRPMLAVVLIGSGVGLVGYTLSRGRTKPAELPRAKIKR